MDREVHRIRETAAANDRVPPAMKMREATEALVHHEKDLPGDTESPGKENTSQQKERLPEDVGMMGATIYAARGDTIMTTGIRTVQVPTIDHQT